jgi:hypothetical protein
MPDDFDRGYKRGFIDGENAANKAKTAGGKAPLTIEDIKAGKVSNEEIIARKAEVDALLAAGGQS